MLIPDIAASIRSLDASPDSDAQVARVKKAVETSPDDLYSLYPSIKSLCISSSPAVRCIGYQLVRTICPTRRARRSHIEWNHLWTFLSHAKLERDPSALKAQLDALETMIESQHHSLLLVNVFEDMLTWLPDGSDVWNHTVETLKRCDDLLMMIMRKSSSLLVDSHVEALLERYCSSARCALQSDRFHLCNSVDDQPTLSIEERTTRLLDFLDYIQRYGFIPDASLSTLTSTICWLSYHFNVCVAPSSQMVSASPNGRINGSALNKRLFQMAKTLLEDTWFGETALEGVLLPGPGCDWHFAVGAIFIARGLVWDTFFKEEPGVLVQRELIYEEHHETTKQFNYWMPILGKMPKRWADQDHGDRVLVELSYFVEEIILYCKYHQSSEMAAFVGEVTRGLADALKRYRYVWIFKNRKYFEP